MNGRNIPYIFRGRNITLPRGETAIQIALTGDNLSNRITFVLDKVYNGVDLSAYEPQLLLTGTFMDEPQEDIITLTTGLTKAINGTTIEVVWTVGSTQTYQSGTGTAQIRFVSSSAAVWHSNIFNLSVGSSLSVDGSAEEHDPSVIVDHTARLLALETEIVDKADKDGDKVLTDNNLTDALKAGYDDAVTKAHTHTNKSTLDNITAAYTAEEQAKLAGIDEDINARMTAVESGKINTSVIDTDNNLTANDNNKIASQRAVKTYTDTKFRTIADSYTKSEIEALICNATYVVDTYAEMLAIPTPQNMVSCFVRDASADPTVTSGAAFYKYDKENPSGATWLKLFESEGIDVIQTAANVTVTARSAPYNVENQELLNTAMIGQIGNKANTADLKPHAFNDLATALGAETDKAPTNKLLNDTAAFKAGLAGDNIFTGANKFDRTINGVTNELSLNESAYDIFVCRDTANPTKKTAIAKGYVWCQESDNVYGRFASQNIHYGDDVNGYEGTLKFPAANIGGKYLAVTDNADGTLALDSLYDVVIKTQAEFEALIADPTWFGAKSVALVGQFTLSTANNSGVKIPATVKQIHGYNSAKITITNFVYNPSTAKGGLWYDTAPTTQDYSIRDLEVSCTGLLSRGFSNCNNLSNCTGTGTSTATNKGYGFSDCNNLSNCTGTGTGASGGFGFYTCDNLSNCTGTGTGTTYGRGFSECNNLSNCTGTGTGTTGFGFYNCINLSNCTGTGTATTDGYGFRNCNNLSNCTGTGTGTNGYGFSSINYAVNCKDGGSSTDMWGGTNNNIDLDTCCKTPVTADNSALNT